MRFSRTNRYQISRHFLLKWYKLDANIPDLDEVGKVYLKILYSALKQLTPDERKFLADKYRVAPRPKRPSMTDGEMAEQYGWGLDKYRQERAKIEIKLKPFLDKYKDKYQEELSTAIDLRYEENGTTKRREKETKEFMEMIEQQARERYENSMSLYN